MKFGFILNQKRFFSPAGWIEIKNSRLEFFGPSWDSDVILTRISKWTELLYKTKLCKYQIRKSKKKFFRYFSKKKNKNNPLAREKYRPNTSYSPSNLSQNWYLFSIIRRCVMSHRAIRFFEMSFRFSNTY